MNVALFASAFHPHFGGVEELVRQLAHELQRRGHGVIVLTNRWPRDLPAFEEFEGLPVYRLPFRTAEKSLKSQLTYRFTHERICTQTLRILDRHAIDVIHVQCVGGNAHYALRAANTLALPLVVSLQGELSMDATRLFERSAFARETMRSALNEADFITACSRQTLAEAESFLGTAFAAPSQVVRNGIRVADFAGVSPFQHPRRYLLGIGRHVPQKGFDVLLRAMALLRRGGRKDVDLVLAGDGPEKPALELLANELGVRDRVVFFGRCDRPTTASLFAGCELFVLPSRHEPFGIVNLEAMACGKPVVASRTGGVPEIVRHGETGWLVPPGDPAALAMGIAAVLDDEGLRRLISDHGRKLAEEHDWRNLGEAYETIYHAVLDKHTPPAMPIPTSVEGQPA